MPYVLYERDGRVLSPYACPVPCDDDCEVSCHEAHTVKWKREHAVDECERRVEHENLHWLVASGQDVQFGAGDHDGGAMVYAKIIDEEPVFWGCMIGRCLELARQHSEREGITPLVLR